MSNFHEFNAHTWDAFFDFIGDSTGDESRSDVQTELATIGIDLSQAKHRLSEMLRSAATPPEGRTQTRPAFSHGDAVRIRSQRDRRGTVLGQPRRIAQENWYTVHFGSEQRRVPESSLERDVAGLDVYSLLRARSFGNKRSFSSCVTFTKLRHPLRNTLYSFRSTRTQFHSYQFKPLIKFLDSSARRLLIADEVGLGKTIESGFILRELQAREDLRRVLIVCPSRLCSKWKQELLRRFDEDFTILDSGGLRSFLEDVEERQDRVRLNGICSLQTLRSRSTLEAFEATSPPLDLVIVDESHHMRNRDTLSNRAGHALNDCAESMILLTATPIHLGNENLFALLNILAPKEFDRYEEFERVMAANEHILNAERAIRAEGDLSASKAALRQVERTVVRDRFLRNPIYRDVLAKMESYDVSRRDQLVDLQQELSQLNVLSHILTRTKKRDVHIQRARRTPRVVPVEFSLDEKEFYSQATDLCIDWYARTSGDWGARFAVITLQRQMASSIPAFLEKYRSRTAALIEVTGDDQSDLDPEDWIDGINGNEVIREKATLSEHPAFRRLLGSYDHLRSRDSKYEALLELLRTLDQSEPGRKILVFSYFKGSLEYLARRLREDGQACVVIHGDVRSDSTDPQRDERGARMRQFRDDDSIRILLSSEVGSEGLDFQFCHILVNYDLPWNPMVVEQRIGRLDRLGQKAERIVICNFSVKGTVEDRILDRLYNRIKIFEGSIGDVEPILGDEIRQLTEELLSSKLTPFEQEALIEERALALERRRTESERLERESSRFLGHDEFFNEEIGRVQSLRRYLGGDELRVFLAEFFRAEVPRCSIQPSRQKGCWWITATTELEMFVREQLPPADSGLHDIVGRIQRGGFLVAFDADVAYENGEADLLHSQHPLIRAIAAYYAEHADRMHPVARVVVKTEAVPAADYLYVIALLEVSGARPGRYLEPIVVPVDAGPPLSREMSEMLLSLMIVSGESLDVDLALDDDLLSTLQEKADEELGARLVERREELTRVNSALIEARLDSLTTTYHAKRERKRTQLVHAEQIQRKDHYIRMLQGGLRNDESKYEAQRAELEKGRHVELALNLFAAGIVRVE